MHLVSIDHGQLRLRGRSVAVVGSAPSVLKNDPGFIDSHEVVVRVNNYKTGSAQGFRTDVHYSFYGGSIRKTAAELQSDGVTLCWCKCPNSKPIECEWHERMGAQAGIDFRKIYKRREGFWFCDTVVPSSEHFLKGFELLGKHVPTTGFAAILDALWSEPRKLYITGFDFFESGVHNVDEKWRPGDPADPIGHRPQQEAEWIGANLSNYPIFLDAALQKRYLG